MITELEHYDQAVDRHFTCQKIIERLHSFRENPYLLDCHLERYISTLQDSLLHCFANSSSIDSLWELEVIYAWISIRGHNSIVPFLKAEIWILQQLHRICSNFEADWRWRFVGYLWLARFLDLPFGFSERSAFNLSFFLECYENALLELKMACESRKAASILVARFLAKTGKIKEFLGSLANPSGYHAIGVLQVLKAYLKRSSFGIEAILQHVNAARFDSRICKKLALKIGVLAFEYNAKNDAIDAKYFSFVVDCLCDETSVDIRCSAANSFARILALLSGDSRMALLRNFISNATLNFKAKSAPQLHGLMYAFGEIARKRFIPISELFNQIDELVFWCLFFQGRSSSSSTFSISVRDSACYFFWMAARGQLKEEEATEFKKLCGFVIPKLICTALFDNDINCRRAASACLQIWIGKTLGDSLVHVNLVQNVNFNSVALLKRCYLDLALDLAPEFEESILEHLILRSRRHKDKELRILAAEAFAKICSRRGKAEDLQVLIGDCQSIDPYLLHGSLFFCSFLIKAGFSFDSCFLSIRNNKLLPSIANSLLFEGAFEFVSCSAFNVGYSSADLWNDHFECIEAFIESSSKFDSTLYEKATFETLYFLLNSPVAPLEVLWNRFWKEKEGKIVNFFALLCFPWCGFLEERFHLLWNEWLCELLPKVPIDRKCLYFRGIFLFLKANASHITLGQFNCLNLNSWISTALDDYTVDHRGDVGSFLRLEAISILELYPLAASEQILGKLLRIFVEKMDKLRLSAWNVLKQIPNRPEISQFSNADFLALDSFYSLVLSLLLSVDSKQCKNELVVGVFHLWSAQIEYFQRAVCNAINIFSSAEDTFTDRLIVALFCNQNTPLHFDTFSLCLAKVDFLVFVCEKYSPNAFCTETQGFLLDFCKSTQQRWRQKNDYTLQECCMRIYSTFQDVAALEEFIQNSTLPKLKTLAKQHLELIHLIPQ